MRHEVDYVHREIELTMTEDEGHALVEAIEQLRAKSLFALTPVPDDALDNLLATLTEAHEKLNAPTACCGRLLPDNHPGCACLLEHIERTSWDRVTEGAERAKNQPAVGIHYTTLADRIESARADSERLADRRKAISDFEKLFTPDED